MDEPTKEFVGKKSSPKSGEASEPKSASFEDGYGVEPVVEAPGPSPIAARVRLLKDSTLAAGEKHSRLPQTLFWSLFHTEVSEIKRKKARRKLLDALK